MILLASAKLSLEPDITLFYQLPIFLGLIFVLHSLLFKPALRVIEKRKKATDGASEAIDSLKKMTEEKIQEYEGKIQKAKLVGTEIKEKIKKEGEMVASQILAEAHERSEKILKEMRTSLKNETDLARLILQKHVEDLSKKLATRASGIQFS